MNQLNVSLWRDEAFSVFLAKKDFWDIVSLTSKDTHPPLYHFILHFWMKIFGYSEIALRSLSLTFYLMLVIAVYFLAKEIFKSKRIGFLSSLLTLLNPFLFFYAFEARMYMMLMFLATMSIWFFITKRWKLYILLTTAALYTHNFAIFLPVLALLSFALTQARVNFKILKNDLKNLITRSIKSPFIRSFLLIIILYLPWFPILINQTTRVGGDFWISTKPTLNSLIILFGTFIKGQEQSLSGNYLIMYLILFLAIILFLLRGFNKLRDSVFYLWLLLPALMIFIYSQFAKSIFLDRYLVVSAPALPLLLASQMKEDFITKQLVKIPFLTNIFKKISISLILVLLMALLLLKVDVFVFNNPNHDKQQPFKELADYVKTDLGKDQLIINYYNGRLHYFELKYYGLNVKAYSAQKIPFWNGTALLSQNDILNKISNKDQVIVMASGTPNGISIPGFTQTRIKQFNQLYLIWFSRIEYAFF